MAATPSPDATAAPPNPLPQAFFPELCRGALFVVLSIVASPAGTKATPVDIAVILAEALAGIVASLVLVRALHLRPFSCSISLHSQAWRARPSLPPSLENSPPGDPPRFSTQQSALSGLPLSEPDDAVWQMCPRILRPLRHRILPLLEHGKGRFLLTSSANKRVLLPFTTLALFARTSAQLRKPCSARARA